jgi:hypothetical protein
MSEPLKLQTRAHGVAFELLALQRLVPGVQFERHPLQGPALGMVVRFWCYSLTEPSEARDVVYVTPELGALPAYWCADLEDTQHCYLTLADLLWAVLPPAFWADHVVGAV